MREVAADEVGKAIADPGFDTLGSNAERNGYLKQRLSERLTTDVGRRIAVRELVTEYQLASAWKHRSSNRDVIGSEMNIMRGRFFALGMFIAVLLNPAWAGPDSRTMRTPESLACGDIADFRKIAVNETRVGECFSSLRAWESLRARGTGPNEGTEMRRTFEQTARGAIRYLSELTGLPCHACDRDTIDWDRLPEDAAAWFRATEEYRTRASRELLNEQRRCVLRYVDARVADLESGAPPRDTSVPAPTRLRLAFSDTLAAEVSLDRFAAREVWSDVAVNAALEQAERLRAFVDRGTRETWRALVGAANAEAYRLMLQPARPSIVAQAEQLRGALDVWSRQFDAQLRGGTSESASELQQLSRRAGRFASDAHKCQHVRVVDNEKEVAAVTVCIPTATFVVETLTAVHDPTALEALHRRLEGYRHALNATIANATLGVGVAADH